jgi:hypothetical protein
MTLLLSTRSREALRLGLRLFSISIFFAVVFAMVFACDAPERVERSGTLNIQGVYRVEGLTTEVASGLSRPLSGLLVVRQDGDRYSTNFDLTSDVPASGRYGSEEMSIEVVGEGEGSILGSDLHGTARTQVLRSIVPGVHVSFGMMPRSVGPRIVSVTKGHMGAGGELTIEIETRPEGDADYAPTRTRLVGHRVGEIGEAPALRKVAAPRPERAE